MERTFDLSQVTWQEPPPRGRGAGGAYDLTPVWEMLRERPKEWALVHSGSGNRTSWWRTKAPPGFEFTERTRKVDGRKVVETFGRYVGES